MTVVYSNNFDSNATGSLPTGWANAIGTSSTVIASAAAPSSPNAINIANSGDMCVYTGFGVLNQMLVRYDSAQVSLNFIAVVLLESGGGNYCYIIYPNSGGNLNSTWSIDRTYGGSSNPAISTFTPSGLGSTISIKAQYQSGVISIKLWTYGTTEPSGWTYQYTDTTTPVMPPGYAGFYGQNHNPTGGTAVADNFVLDDLTTPATDFAISPATLYTYPGQATGNWTVTPNSTPSSSTTVALSDGGNGGTFTPTSLTFTTSAPKTFTYTPPSAVGPGYTATITASATGGFTASHNVGCFVYATASDFAFTPATQSTPPNVATGNYTISPNGIPLSSVAVALSDGGAGGTFSPSSLTFTAQLPQTFTYTPPIGLGGNTTTLTATASGGFSATHTATCYVDPVANGITITPTDLATSPGVPTGNYSMVLNGPITANEHVGLSDGGAGGTFSVPAIVFTSANAQVPVDFIYTPANNAGGKTITLRATGTGAFNASTTAVCVVIAAPLFPPLEAQSLQKTIPSYLYLEYNDDDNLQALVYAFNYLMQEYVSLFNNIGLPVYTGYLIVGSLLDWVAQGIYGYARPALPTGASRTIGPVNTFAANVLAPNESKNIAPASLYATTDDIYKRCLTWNLLKGDGKVFNIRWLKRRIMRFLSGINGTNPNIDQTYRISVTFGTGNQVNINILSGVISLLSGTYCNGVVANSGACNVSKSSFTPYQPIPLAAILKSAIDSGALQLPFQFSYVVNA